MSKFLVVLVLAFVLPCSCVLPPPHEEKNPTIEESSPEKPKKQVEIEKALKEEFEKPPVPVPER